MAEAMGPYRELHVAEACGLEQRSQVCLVAQREDARRGRRCRRVIAGDVGVNARIVAVLGHRVDGYRRMAARSKHAMELGERARRIGEEHQRQAAQHRVEARVGEAHRLAVFDSGGDVGGAAEAPARLLDHAGRDVDGGDVPGRPDDTQSGLGNQAGAGGDVEQAMAGGEMACIQHKGHEVPRDARHRLLIAGSGGIGIGQSIQGNSPRPELRDIAGQMPLP